ncbi:unnamed protein product [Meloidogyne enterolobii]|uniref:Uncharacterized protein n=1 Tax=Meloidogyne enterolobii TaxID=390850 RepID=A0ACB0ZNF8_MELEN
MCFCRRKAKKAETCPTKERVKSPHSPKSVPDDKKKRSPSTTPARIIKRSLSPPPPPKQQKKEQQQKKPIDKRKNKQKKKKVKNNQQQQQQKPVETARTLRSSTPTSDSLLLSKKVSEDHFEHVSFKGK